jgi:hypothetical protein
MGPRLANASLGMSYLQMLSTGHPAGFLVSLLGRLANDQYGFALSPARIDHPLEPV